MMFPRDQPNSLTQVALMRSIGVFYKFAILNQWNHETSLVFFFFFFSFVFYMNENFINQKKHQDNKFNKHH